jgi:uncharacterized protein (DUF2235 family)
MTSPTNITLLSRAILQKTKTKNPGTEQVVLYQPGIGTTYSSMTRVWAGAFGEGLIENIREAYGFIVHNWVEGDEIYLFGFSRGAYTARSVAGLISKFGLLSKRGMDGIGYVLDAYRAHLLDDPSQVDKLASKYERKSVTVPIKFVGVWDTVGSLGIPDLYIFGVKASALDFVLGKINQQFQFADTDLHPMIENAFHAYHPLMSRLIGSMALNEVRAPFWPTIWKLRPDNKNTRLQQCWFPGAHASVGGGDPQHGISDITLAWMIQKLTDHTDLEYDLQYLLDSRKTFGPNHMDVRWGDEIWKDSNVGIWKMSGTKARTPNKYLTKDDVGSITNEFIHKSVVTRVQSLGTKFEHPDLGGLEEDKFGEVEKILSW